MPEFYQSRGTYGHRHRERALAELKSLAEKYKPEPKTGEEAAGYTATFQYLVDSSAVNIKVLVYGNSRTNALSMALSMAEVRDFILAAAKKGIKPEYFVVPTGLVSPVTNPEGVISKQGW